MGFPVFLQAIKQNGRDILVSSFVGTVLLAAGYFFLPVSAGILTTGTDWLDWLIFLIIPGVAGIVTAMFTKSFRPLIVSLLLTAVCTVVVLTRLRWSHGFSLCMGFIVWASSLFIGGRLGNLCRRYLVERIPHPRVVENCVIMAMVVPLALVYTYGYEGMNRSFSNVDRATKAIETGNDSAAKRSIDDFLSMSHEWPVLPVPSGGMFEDGLGNESYPFWDKYQKLIIACLQQKQYDLGLALIKRRLAIAHSLGSRDDYGFVQLLAEMNLGAGHNSDLTDGDYAHLLWVAQRDYGRGEMQSAADILTKLVLLKDDANSRYYLGNALMCLGRVAEAKSQYRQALLLKPDADLACCCNKTLAEADSLSSILHEGYVGICLNDNLVYRVSSGSSAEKVGIKDGDKILSVNYRPTVRQSSQEISQMIRGSIGTQVRVSLEREGKKHDIVLTRAKLANSEKLAQRQIRDKLPKRGSCREDGN